MYYNQNTKLQISGTSKSESKCCTLYQPIRPRYPLLNGNQTRTQITHDTQQVPHVLSATDEQIQIGKLGQRRVKHGLLNMH
jgi:hypothetical protein